MPQVYAALASGQFAVLAAGIPIIDENPEEGIATHRGPTGTAGDAHGPRQAATRGSTPLTVKALSARMNDLASTRTISNSPLQVSTCCSTQLPHLTSQ